MFTFIRNRKGATAIEYGLIAALIAVGAMGAIQTTGTQIATTLAAVTANMAAS